LHWVVAFLLGVMGELVTLESLRNWLDNAGLTPTRADVFSLYRRGPSVGPEPHYKERAMIKSLYVMGASLLLLLGVGIGHGLSQDMEDPAGPEKSEKESREDLHKPGDQHAWLKESAGSWQVSAKIWQEPGAVPTELKGTSRLQMLFDRYLYDEVTISQGDEVHEMRGFIGFDNGNKEFNALYIGNMGTDMRLLSGERAGNAVEFTCEAEIGDTKVKQRVTYVRETENRTVVTIFAARGDEPEHRKMELTYTR
jgi:hypothetical protein